MDLLPHDEKTMLPEDWAGYPVVVISVTRQTGIEKLEESIHHAVLKGDGILGENPIVPNLRQKQLIERALSATLRLIGSLEDGNPLEIAAIDAKEAIEALGQITGESIDEAVIDRIFSRFCIGK